jgi:hypothetical protein
VCIAMLVITAVVFYLAIWADNYRRYGRRPPPT